MDPDQIRNNVRLVVDKTRSQWLASDHSRSDTASSQRVSLIDKPAPPQANRRETRSTAPQDMGRTCGKQKQ